MTTLVFFIGVLAGIGLGMGIMNMIQAVHDEAEQMSRHIKANYTVRKPE